MRKSKNQDIESRNKDHPFPTSHQLGRMRIDQRA